MRPLKKSKPQVKICIPILESRMGKAIEAAGEAAFLADLIEIRADYLKEPGLVRLMRNRKRPFIVTNRRKEEGGAFRGNEQERFSVLKEAVRLGVDYVDVEMKSNPSLLQDLMINKNASKIILSSHHFQKTPSQRELQELCRRMSRSGADVIKIVTMARSWEDNLHVLSLIPFAEKMDQKIVAFCMGEKGKWSRLFAPFMGAAWTYAAFSKARVSAPGQLTVGEMKTFWEMLKSEG